MLTYMTEMMSTQLSHRIIHTFTQIHTDFVAGFECVHHCTQTPHNKLHSGIKHNQNFFKTCSSTALVFLLHCVRFPDTLSPPHSLIKIYSHPIEQLSSKQVSTTKQVTSENRIMILYLFVSISELQLQPIDFHYSDDSVL